MHPKPDLIARLESQYGVEFAAVAECSPADFARYGRRDADRARYMLDEAGRITGLTLRTSEVTEVDWLAEPALENLWVLNLTENKITALTIPTSLSELRYLDMSDNPELTTLELPESFPYLAYLDASDSGLTAFALPAGCTQLDWLDLSRNQMRQCELGVGLTALRYFDVSENKELSTLNLPAGLNMLQFLYAGKCSLTEFRIAGQVPELRILELRENALEELPRKAYQKLETLYVKGNPLKGFEEQLIEGDEGGNALSVISFIRAIEQGGEKDNHRVKLVVVGNGRVGKTSLIRRLRGESLDPNEKFTHGIDISILTKQELPAVKTKELDLRVWDFGGQEVFYATHQFFLSENAIYLYVWTDREIALANANKDQIKPIQISTEADRWRSHDHWLENIRMHGLDSPILPVRTHFFDVLARGNERTFNYPELKRRYALRYSQLDFDAESTDPRFVNGLREALTNLVNKNDLLGKPYPIIYDLLIDKLKQERERGRSELSKASVIALAAHESVGIDAKDIDGVLQYLRTIGEIIYYPLHPKLKDRVFIAPQELTKSVYQLLEEHEELEKNNGAFTPDFAYDKLGENWETLLALLESFDLIYRREIAGDVRYYYPLYLPKLPEPGKTSRNFFELQKRHLVLKYELRYPDFLPENIMVNVLSNYGPLALEEVFKDAIVFEEAEPGGQATIQLIGEGKEQVIQVFTEKTGQGRAVARGILQTFIELSKKAKLQVGDEGSREWVDSKHLLLALKENRDIVTVSGSYLPKNAFDGIRAANRADTFSDELEHFAIDKQMTRTSAPEKQKLLFVCCSPDGPRPLKFGQEFREIEQAWERSRERTRFAEIKIKPALERGEFSRCINNHLPHFLHLAMHATTQEGLYFENKRGEVDVMTVEQFKRKVSTLCDHEKAPDLLELVVLNACNSLAFAEAVLPYTKYAVGMRDFIRDEASVVYAKAFYQAIFDGHSINHADKLGRDALQDEEDRLSDPRCKYPVHEIPHLLINPQVDE